MRPRYKAAVGIIAIALVWGGASAAVFVFIGTELAIYLLGAIVPVLALAGLAYVRRGSGGGSEQRIQEQRAREVGSTFADVYGDYRAIQDTYPELAANIDLPLEQVISELEQEDISVDRETGSTSLGRFSSPDVTTLASIESDIEDLDSQLDQLFVEAVREEIRRINSQLRRLDSIIEINIDRTPDEVPDPSSSVHEQDDSWWRTLGRDVENYREHARNEVSRAAEAVRASMRQADDVDKASVEESLSSAESAEDVETGVEAVLTARDTLRQEASGSFKQHRRELLALAEAVQSADIDEHIERTRIEEFEAAVEEVESIDDAVEMAELGDRGNQLRAVCTDIIRELEKALENDLSTVEEADLPEDYYQRPNAAERSHASEVASATTLQSYRSEWMDAATELTDALATIDRKARVASMYAELENIIESEMRRKGEVTGDDLPVKRDHEQFLGLYARTHDVDFDPSVPALSTPGGGEQYSVTAKASFEDGGEERTARVEIDGPEYRETMTITTYFSEIVEFEDVPYGTYTIRSVPENDDNESAEADVTVESDVTVELEMADIELRDRLCSGYDDADIRMYVEEMEERFADRLESDGYISTEMEFPIADDYIPCLFAVWAERTGRDVTEDGDTVIVYDGETVTEEMRMVAQHNLDSGESMDYATLRERFLSAPVPDKGIQNVAAAIEQLSAGETTIRKRES